MAKRPCRDISSRLVRLELGALEVGVSTLTRAEAEDFLYREARMLDERRFAEWINLFTDDGCYWIPCGQGEDPGPITHIVYDDRAQLADRVWQLQHPRRFSQSPSSATTHLVSNIEVADEAVEECTILSSFVLYEVRKTQGGAGSARPFAGRYEHRLRREDDRWRIAMKKVWLIDRDLSLHNLTFLL